MASPDKFSEMDKLQRSTLRHIMALLDVCESMFVNEMELEGLRGADEPENILEEAQTSVGDAVRALEEVFSS